MKSLKKILLASALILGASNTVIANDAVKTMREFYKIADARPFNADQLRAFYADHFVDHDHAGGSNSVDSAIGTFTALAAGSPDSVHELEMVIPSGEDKAIIYWRYKGTNTAGLFGMPVKDKPRKFDIAGIEIYTVKDGKITEMWHVEEIHKLVEQLTAE